MNKKITGKDITLIEKILLKKRGYLYKKPEKNDPVILLVSGGVDSIVLWHILLFKFKLKVFPLFLKNPASTWFDHQYRSVKFFEKYYKKKFSTLCEPVMSLNLGNTLRTQILKATNNNSKLLFDSISFYRDLSIPSYSTTLLLSSAALDYLQLIQAKKNIAINHIFTANFFDDGELVRNQTLVSLRSINLNLVINSGINSLQFTSPFMEVENKDLYGFSKIDCLNWAKSHKIPIVKTWTCWDRSSLLPCGKCVACKVRKEAFDKVSLKDNVSKHALTSFLLTKKHQLATLKVVLKKLWNKGNNQL